jgi:uncharacterized protein YkwD
MKASAAAASVAAWLACWAAAAWAADPAGTGAEACARFDPAEVLAVVNEARARGGECGRLGRFEPARRLAWQPDLAEAAQRQARWIAERGELLHQGPRGEALAERTRAAGYAFRRVNENLALGQRSPAEVVGDWLGSEGHCANLLDASVTEFGLATACTASGDKVWVMVAGRR